MKTYLYRGIYFEICFNSDECSVVIYYKNNEASIQYKNFEYVIYILDSKHNGKAVGVEFNKAVNTALDILIDYRNSPSSEEACNIMENFVKNL